MKKLRATFVKSCPGLEYLPDDGLPEVAFIGRSNVGKSSLLNILTQGRDIARTSCRPGCTQYLNLYSAGGEFYLVDLPGYGYAKAPERLRRSWSNWINTYLEERQTLRGVVLLVDSRHPELESDAEMSEYLRARGRPYVIALTKSDKLKRGKLSQTSRTAGEMGPVIVVSSKTGAGVQELRKWLLKAIAV